MASGALCVMCLAWVSGVSAFAAPVRVLMPQPRVATLRQLRVATSGAEVRVWMSECLWWLCKVLTGLPSLPP
jgi:hypothetical protein